ILERGCLGKTVCENPEDLVRRSIRSRTGEVGFAEATTFKDGAKALCDRLAEAFDQSGMWETCPVAATLFEGPDNDEFRAHAAHLYEGWIAEVHDHAERLGMDHDTAQAAAEHLFVLLQGSWMLARARRSSDVLRELPERL
ncbi:MAG: hypothetical protein AAFR68_04640, partial [Pseudomonadota bacterium]